MSSDKPGSALQSADPLRNFSISTEERIRAIAIGVPAWAARKRRIEDEEVKLVRELVELRRKLVAKGRSADDVERAVGAAARSYDLTKLNVLVEKHNRWYPIEANLPMDRRGHYLVYGRVWTPEDPYTAARLIALAARPSDEGE